MFCLELVWRSYYALNEKIMTSAQLEFRYENVTYYLLSTTISHYEKLPSISRVEVSECTVLLNASPLIKVSPVQVGLNKKTTFA